jgi:capsule biosynthesis phosphatase
MRICIDIDGTICALREPHQNYKNVAPLPGAAQKIKELRQSGNYIILNTARHMKTCESNVGLVIAREGLTLLEWLKEHEFEYDEIWFGKPYAHIYIDDKALKFEGSWDSVNETIIKNYL